MNKEEKLKKNKKWKTAMYIISPITILSIIAFFCVMAVLNFDQPVIVKVPCVNESGICSTYEKNKPCILNISDTTGGTSCTTNCMDDHIFYDCVCPLKKKWDAPIALTCQQECLNETTDCATYTHGKQCIASSSNTNQATNCTALCTNGTGTFQCSCEASGGNWSQTTLKCIKACSNKTAINCKGNGTSCYVDDAIAAIIGPDADNTTCTTLCSNTTLQFKCDCLNSKRWSPVKLSCVLPCEKDLPCPPINSNYDQQLCELSSPIVAAGICKGECFNDTNGVSKKTYKCECAQGYQWNPKPQLTCDLICKNASESNCSLYPDATPCILTSSGNGKISNCTSSCGAGTASYTCSCILGIWDATVLKCMIDCPTIMTTCPAPDLPCKHRTNFTDISLDGGTNCKTQCIKETCAIYKCDCPADRPGWDKNLLECLPKCEKSSTLPNPCNDKKFCLFDGESNGEFDCQISCTSLLNFECKCYSKGTWNPENLKCFRDCQTNFEVGTCSTCDPKNRPDFMCKVVSSAQIGNTTCNSTLLSHKLLSP